MKLFNATQRLMLIIKHNNLSKIFEYSKSQEKDEGPLSLGSCFDIACKLIVKSLFSDKPEDSYAGVILLQPKLIPAWTQQIVFICKTVCSCLNNLKLDPSDSKPGRITTYLNVLVSFTSTVSWMVLRNTKYQGQRNELEKVCQEVTARLFETGLYKCLNALLIRGLSRIKPTLSKLTLMAIVTVAIRPLALVQSPSTHHLQYFILYIISVPGLVHHLNVIAPGAIHLMCREEILSKCIGLLTFDNPSEIVFTQIEGNYILCLMANLINLAYITVDSIQPLIVDFVVSTLPFITLRLF